MAGCSVVVVVLLGGYLAEGFARGGAAAARGAVPVGVGVAVGAGMRADVVEAGVAGDGIAPGEDALRGRGVGVGAGERVSS